MGVKSPHSIITGPPLLSTVQLSSYVCCLYCSVYAYKSDVGFCSVHYFTKLFERNVCLTQIAKFVKVKKYF